MLEKGKEKAPVKINNFEDFFKAVNFYKNELNEIKKINEETELEMWFIYLSKINCNIYIDENNIEVKERKFVELKYEGIM